MSIRRFLFSGVVLFIAGALAVRHFAARAEAHATDAPALTSARMVAADASADASPGQTRPAARSSPESSRPAPESAPAASEVAALPSAAKARAASEALAAIAKALDATTDASVRSQLIQSALTTWAATDIDAAGAWSLAPTEIDRRTALGAVIRGGAAADPVLATQFVGKLSLESPQDALVLGHELILALTENGHYAAAAAWAAAGQQSNPAWINDAYSRWASVERDAALASASAISAPAAREMAIAAVTNAPEL